MTTKVRLTKLYDNKEIKSTVRQIAKDITRDYKGKNPLIIGILKGSFIFIADLVRELRFPLEIEFIRLSSYGRGQTSSGKVKVLQKIAAKIKGRDVLIVEDIIDSGVTLNFLIDYILKKQPSSLKLCCLLDKVARRRIPVTIDYVGLIVPDKFLVGYGLDWDEKYRNLPDICCVEDEIAT